MSHCHSLYSLIYYRPMKWYMSLFRNKAELQYRPTTLHQRKVNVTQCNCAQTRVGLHSLATKAAKVNSRLSTENSSVITVSVRRTVSEYFIHLLQILANFPIATAKAELRAHVSKVEYTRRFVRQCTEVVWKCFVFFSSTERSDTVSCGRD